ncbi:methyltransferase [Actinokineospora enzanensis]|uniref:methyltransferase n=1 Tax=Actinokineospora enzanensis TaxID=155975 RepID=UPI0003A3748B|nr:methyltransferase [Actinokineospora enzanensis]
MSETVRANGPMDTAGVMRLTTAYAESRLLHSAVEVGVFELLANGPAVEPEIRRELSLHARFLPHFLDALVALGLLEKDGESYRNAPAAAQVLVPGGEVFLGGRVRAAATKHYHTWGRLTDALRDGEAKAGGGPNAFKRLYSDPAQTRAFLIHMDANNGQVAPQLAATVDWSGIRDFVDVGGARGNVAAHLVAAHPHLHGGVFELPAVEPVFDELMAERGLTGKVTFHGGDFFADPLPATDAIVLGHVLHDWSGDRCVELLERVRDALNPGGAVVIYDQMLDETAPALRSLIGSLNVGLITEGGGEYTVSRCRTWLEKAGFRFAKATPFPQGNDTVVVGIKN